MVQDTGIDSMVAAVEEAILNAEGKAPDAPEVIDVKSDALPFDADDSMVTRTVSSAGYRYLYDVETKEKVPILYYMLPQQLRKMTQDGKRRRFSATKPPGEPWRGNVKCLLHKDNPARERFKTMGFRECRKSNIQNPHALTQHMRLKHPQEWKAMEDEKRERERQEDRALQQAILGQIKPQPAAQSEGLKCDVCGKECKTRLALAGHKRSHK